MIAFIITARSSYTKVKPILDDLQKRAAPFTVIACASALLERYGRVVDVIKKDGFPVEAELYTVVEGETLETSVHESAMLSSSLGHALHGLRPTIGVVVADRHEVLSAAQSCSYLHIPLVHLQGGEISGSIDDKVRNAITQLADYHFVCTERAATRVFLMTNSIHIYQTGCPSIDLAKQALTEPPVSLTEMGGAGADIDLNHPFLVVLQHSVTNEASHTLQQMRETLAAVKDIALPMVMMWPGEDAGSDGISKAIRLHMNTHPNHAIHTVRNLPPNRFLRLLSQAACLIGNSSVGIRECSYIGTPVVDIGTRQHGREHSDNVMNVYYNHIEIKKAIERQLSSKRHFLSSTLYGDGTAADQSANILCRLLSHSS